MASASDVRAILSLPANTPGPSQPRKSTATASRKPEGISRELYSLIGDSAPTLVAQYARPKFKPKLDLGKSRARWTWRTFANPGRSDSLKLAHWTKGALDEKDSVSEYAKYNTPSQVYTYSQDDYVKFLQDDEWSKEETDYLFSLAREYDLRFLVMADRYDFPGGRPRNIEDLKSRYYGVCRRLIRNRPWAGDEASKNQVLASYGFDAEQERNRKAYLTGLFDRTPEQIAEEEQLYVEIKRLELNEKRYAKERDDLLRTFAGVESGLPGLQANWDISTGVPIDKKRKKRVEGDMTLDSPIGGPSSSMLPPKRRDIGKQSASDVQHCIVRFDAPLTSVSSKSSTPAHLRSTRIPLPKTHLAPKTTTILAELGVSASRLVMPTRANIERLENLQTAAASLIEMKKNVDRVEQEIRVLQAQSMRASEVPSAVGGTIGGEDEDAARVSAGPSSGGVLKLLDKRARKRSMSMSSNGTSTGTRGNNKRTRRD
ncbi:hypothetical protein BS47DRAFT_1317687 [Hydnum rufescens UP504]|uniref:SWR1-complex protein 4 n=1 Tax=Hydnum rufescens UP504 TaxID=1448309 RepID=A0A9P6AWG8_9AGAM|nr:hypothetical protein BS47DRAFT_1317687 [Hydnum rufescens UP504]